MPSEPLTLYADRFWMSPYVLSVFVTLHEKGLSFDIEEIALDQRGQDDAKFRALSLTGRVPTLVHGKLALSESTAIVEYLEEAFPSPHHARVLPAGAEARARARQVMAWLRSDLDALREERPTSTVFYDRASTPLSVAGERAAQKLIRVASALVPADGSPLFGSPTVADVDLAMMLQRLVANDHPVPEPLRVFTQSTWLRPSVQAFLANDRPTYVPY